MVLVLESAHRVTGNRESTTLPLNFQRQKVATAEESSGGGRAGLRPTATALGAPSYLVPENTLHL